MSGIKEKLQIGFKLEKLQSDSQAHFFAIHLGKSARAICVIGNNEGKACLDILSYTPNHDIDGALDLFGN